MSTREQISLTTTRLFTAPLPPFTTSQQLQERSAHIADMVNPVQFRFEVFGRVQGLFSLVFPRGFWLWTKEPNPIGNFALQECAFVTAPQNKLINLASEVGFGTLSRAQWKAKSLETQQRPWSCLSPPSLSSDRD